MNSPALYDVEAASGMSNIYGIAFISCKFYD